MKKFVVSFALMGALTVAFSSCNKCYNCRKEETKKTTAGFDTLYVYQTDYCSGGKEGAGTNLGNSIEDIEKNGYKCTQK